MEGVVADFQEGQGNLQRVPKTSTDLEFILRVLLGIREVREVHARDKAAKVVVKLDHNAAIGNFGYNSAHLPRKQSGIYI